MTAPVIGNVAADHPAKWSTPVLDTLAEIVADERERVGIPLAVLDPFAGIGRGRLYEALHPDAPVVDGVELQPEWCPPGTIVGDACHLPADWTGNYHAVVTSPCYGNRMADHHDATDRCKACNGLRHRIDIPHAGEECRTCKGTGLSWRNTYAHALRRHGGELVPGSAAALQWGSSYRALHRRALVEMVRVVVEGGLLAINMSNHIRDGQEQLVVEWWLNEVILAGCQIREVRRITTRRQRNGANGHPKKNGSGAAGPDPRVDGEVVIVAHTPSPRRLV